MLKYTKFGMQLGALLHILRQSLRNQKGKMCLCHYLSETPWPGFFITWSFCFLLVGSPSSLLLSLF
jgi:hypothetical protein